MHLNRTTQTWQRQWSNIFTQDSSVDFHFYTTLRAEERFLEEFQTPCLLILALFYSTRTRRKKSMHSLCPTDRANKLTACSSNTTSAFEAQHYFAMSSEEWGLVASMNIIEISLAP